MAKAIAPHQYPKVMPSIAETQDARLSTIRESEGMDEGAQVREDEEDEDAPPAHYTASHYLGDNFSTEGAP